MILRSIVWRCIGITAKYASQVDSIPASPDEGARSATGVRVGEIHLTVRKKLTAKQERRWRTAQALKCTDCNNTVAMDLQKNGGTLCSVCLQIAARKAEIDQYRYQLDSATSVEDLRSVLFFVFDRMFGD